MSWRTYKNDVNDYENSVENIYLKYWLVQFIYNIKYKQKPILLIFDSVEVQQLIN